MPQLDPDYEPNTKLIGRAAEALDGQNVTADNRIVPPMNVMFRCEKCGRATVANGYLGPVSCSSMHPKQFMRPEALL